VKDINYVRSMEIAPFGLDHLPIPAKLGGAIEERIYELCKRLSKRHEVHIFSIGYRKCHLVIGMALNIIMFLIGDRSRNTAFS